MDVLGNTPPPSTCIDACLSDGFHLENGTKIGNGSGCLLISGEAFEWRPWESSDGMRNSMVNAKGQWEVPEESWGALDLVWPKPGTLQYLTALCGVADIRYRTVDLGARWWAVSYCAGD
jgi:hypothetical protein